jgi:hypothetical protein
VITGRISGKSITTSKGQMGGQMKTIVNNFAVKNVVKIQLKSMGTDVEVVMGANGTLQVTAKKGGQLVFAQNI